MVRSHKKRKLFLDQLEVGSSENFAANAAGATLRAFRKWRDDDPNFKQDWEEALEAGTDYLEDVATDRAMKKSDPLMIMMLKARRPDKYDRGGKLELSGNLNVEGSKTKLLNKIARLQAASRQEVLEERKEKEEGQIQESQEIKALPAPDPSAIRGRKRRGSHQGSGREEAAEL
jgi:hypothetical protein